MWYDWIYLRMRAQTPFLSSSLVLLYWRTATFCSAALLRHCLSDNSVERRYTQKIRNSLSHMYAQHYHFFNWHVQLWIKRLASSCCNGIAVDGAWTPRKPLVLFWELCSWNNYIIKQHRLLNQKSGFGHNNDHAEPHLSRRSDLPLNLHLCSSS